MPEYRFPVMTLEHQRHIAPSAFPFYMITFCKSMAILTYPWISPYAEKLYAFVNGVTYYLFTWEHCRNSGEWWGHVWEMETV